MPSMRATTSSAATLFAVPLLAEYEADPELNLLKRLFEQTIDEKPFQALAKPGVGRPGWPVRTLLRALVLQRLHAWHDRTLVSELQDNGRVRYLVGLPLGTRVAPSRTALVNFRNAVVDHGLALELFEQHVGWIGAQAGLVAAAADDFGIDSTRCEAAPGQPTVIGLLQHALRRVLLAARDCAPAAAAALAAAWHLEAFLGPRFQRCSRGIRSRSGRRLWRRWYRTAERVLAGLGDLRARHEAIAAAAQVLERIMAERGPDGLQTPPDRLTNALDPEVRFGCKGDAAHRQTWQGTKVSLVTHLGTDLIVGLDVMYADRADKHALTWTLDQAAGLLGAGPLARLHADSAYTDADSRRAVTRRRTVLIGPRRGKVRRGRVRGGGQVTGPQERGKRCHIERVHAHLVRYRGNRRAWYLGLTKTFYQTALSAVAANLVRLCTLVRQGRLQLPAAPA